MECPRGCGEMEIRERHGITTAECVYCGETKLPLGKPLPPGEVTEFREKVWNTLNA